jgi:hypothetical protein
MDERAHRRYPIELDVEYKLFSKGKIDRLGAGKTLNVSSGGVWFESADPLPARGAIELVMSWPFLLEGICPLKLVVHGRIVRKDGHRVAVQAKHHEFRTAGVRAARASAAAGGGRSIAR